MQSVPALINEISVLETEVVVLERHLLSLYRTAFSQFLSSSYYSSPIREENRIYSNNGLKFDEAPKLTSEITSSSSTNRHSPVTTSSPTNVHFTILHLTSQ